MTTDVAARGIDIPLIDHVIHYHFAPNAKLFVHRSGRAARAGRIGFCWSLVEPDELPYMVDLHLFLGRKPMTAADVSESRGDGKDYTYTLSEMDPEMVHYGPIPESVMTHEVENVRRIMDSELTGSDDAESMKALHRVCANAMKQYRRTRPEASKEGSRRAKAIMEGTKIETGQRIGGGALPPHPLLRGMELTKYEDAKSKGKIGALNDLENQRKREEFLAAVSNFRPKETIFEAFATGGGKDVGIVSQVDRGRTTGNKKHDSSFALSAMKSMRRQMRLTRDKGTAMVVAGSSNAAELNGEVEPDTHDGTTNYSEASDPVPSKDKVSKRSSKTVVSPDAVVETKRRLSKAERKRLKKNPNAPIGVPSTAKKEEKAKAKRDFRDPTFFIDNDIHSNPEEAQRQRTVEAAMQPSSQVSAKGAMGQALRLEEAMLDIVGDENEELVQKQRMMRWDKSKRKYVQTTVGAELSGESYSKRMKLESGQKVKSDKLKLGEVYEKWQKKTNRSVGRDGVFDDPAGNMDDDAGPSRSRGNKSGKNKNSDKEVSAAAIKKGREKQSDLKLKNMKKNERKRVESQSRQSQQSDKGKPKKGFQGKKGSSGRWGSNLKRKK